MHKGLELTPLHLEVENPFGESLKVFSTFDNDEFEYEGTISGEGSMADKPTSGSGSWEDFQSLSPFGADWEMEQEFFKSDLNDVDCKAQGPTLAELNDQRSLSPLINPEMERLHRIATRTEAEASCSIGTAKFARRTQPLSMDVLDKKTEEQFSVFFKDSKAADVEGKEGSVPSEPRQERRISGNPNVSGGSYWSGDEAKATTCTGSQNPDEERTIELKSCELMKRIVYLESKLDVKSTLLLPKLVSADLKSQLYAMPRSEGQGQKENNMSPRELVSYEETTKEDENMVAHDDSADEEMDSEDDFDEDNLTQSRKGRRGDTDDLNPNPRRLLEIGRELNRLTKVIGELKPIHSLPLNARNKSKKEKNKLASRACRLKKKAQHEGNKLKLHGLELEQQRLIQVIDKVRTEIIHNTHTNSESGGLSHKVESMVRSAVGKQVVAGHTSEFIDSVLKATAQANPGHGDLDVHLNI